MHICSHLSRVSRDQQLLLPLSKYRQAATNNVLVFWKRKISKNLEDLFPFLALRHIYVAVNHTGRLFHYNAGLYVPAWLRAAILCNRSFQILFLGLLMEMAHARTERMPLSRHVYKLIIYSMWPFYWIPSLVKFLPEQTSPRNVGFFISKQRCLWETEPINYALRTPDTNTTIDVS